MDVQAIKTRVFKKDEDLSLFVFEHLAKIPERSVLVVASKIVALSEGRTAKTSEKNALIKKESSWALKVGKVWLTEKDGMIMANAGIDESNADEGIVLLPKDSFASAERLRKTLQKKYQVKNLGVVITDSALMPLRSGVVGGALGYAGFKGVRDYRGKKDIFGRKMKMSRTNIADSLATTATLVMGEGREQQPLALMTGAPVEFKQKVNKKELQIPAKEDIFWPMLRNIKKQKR